MYEDEYAAKQRRDALVARCTNSLIVVAGVMFLIWILTSLNGCVHRHNESSREHKAKMVQIANTVCGDRPRSVEIDYEEWKVRCSNGVLMTLDEKAIELGVLPGKSYLKP